MTRKIATPTAAAQAERFARYCKLRDAGMFGTEAGDEVGVKSATQGAYERAWRDRQGLPRRERRVPYQ